MKILNKEYHRNGISGQSFYSIVFEDDGDIFHASLFDFDGYCAVHRIKDLAQEDVDQRWRGDYYENKLRNLIKKDN